MGGVQGMQRLAVLTGALALFAVLIAVVAVGGGEQEPELAAEVPEECLPLWNDDEGARGMARHTLIHHNDAALAFLIDDDGNEVEEGGDCAVVFPSAETEAEFALNVWTGKRWRSVAYFGEVPVKRVEELQAKADTEPNVRIDEEGRLHPLGES